MPCIPCRVKFNDKWYRIASDGTVFQLNVYGVITRTELNAASDVRGLDAAEAKLVRNHASRLRTNRNRRERDQAMRDLGLVKTPYGWE